MIMNTAATLPAHRLTVMLVPKAANSSIKWALLKALGIDDPGDRLHAHPALGLLPAPEALRRYPGHMVAAFVRNPYARLVSCYVQKIRTWRCESQGFARLGFSRDMPFAAFVDRVAARPLANLHFAPQWDLIGRRAPDLLGRVESLAADWARLQLARPGLALPPLTHRNASRHGPYRGYFDDHARGLAGDAYEDDCRILGYAF